LNKLKKVFEDNTNALEGSKENVKLKDNIIDELKKLSNDLSAKNSLHLNALAQKESELSSL